MVKRVIRFVNLFFTGLTAGSLLSIWFVEREIRSFSASDYTRIEQAKHRPLGPLFTALVSLSDVSSLAALLLSRGTPTFFPTFVASLCGAAATVSTLRINVPINAEQMTWSIGAPPANWAAIRDRWQRAHSFRTVLWLVAMACQVSAALAESGDTG
ncbi:MAG: DUF1772 domain-containing protein [Chloroflexota bacterium]|nr:DUF1772 domain-containing protein [Chloroflexota bacterium]